MKLFLFGGAETGQAAAELKLVEEVIKSTSAKQVLHIPFARITATEPEWDGDWYHRYMSLPDVEYLNAESEDAIVKATNPLIFISGGKEKLNLLNTINANPLLLDLIKNASYIIGESAGAKVLGTHVRVEDDKILPGLNIIKDTVIEPHYTERNRQNVLADVMKQTGAQYGIGIDTVTAIAFELEEWPKKYEKIGTGNIALLRS